MYKALIIDDEEPARRAIKALGAWEQHNVSTLLEAENGRQGLKLLKVHQPDIVFVDMRMPLLGGTEFLQEARLLSAAKFVVISGFDEFEYAKRAMQAGALDYLLKPIKRAELNQVLEKAVQQIEETKTRQIRDLSNVVLRNISAPLVKEKIFTSIIDQNGRFHRIKELEEVIGSAAGASFYTVVLTVLNLSEVRRIKFAADAHACYYALTNAINELLKGLGRAFSFKSSKEEQEIVAVLSADAPIEPGSAKAEIEHVLIRLKETFGVQALAGFSLAPKSLEHLDLSYQSSKSIVLHANMLDIRPVLLEEWENRPIRKSILEKKELLYHALEAGSAVHAVRVVRDYASELEQSGFFSMEDMLKTVAELRLVLEQCVRDFALPESVLPPYLERYDRLFEHPVTDFASFVGRSVSFCEEFFHDFLQRRKPRDKLSAEKIKEYIDLHYFEDISIAGLTEKYFVSKEHLLRLFKQKYGCGIYEYTLKVRMSKAKELLADPSLKIQTVGEKVGYHEQNYFSKAFKKHYGLSPQEYRLTLAKG